MTLLGKQSFPLSLVNAFCARVVSRDECKHFRFQADQKHLLLILLDR